MSESVNSYWIIVASLFFAAVLAVLPLNQAMMWWRPEWVLLVLLYWAIALPHRVGLVTALVVGLLLDVMEGAAMGQNMLSLAVIITLALLLYQRLRVFSPIQQGLVVFVLVGLHQLITQWLQNLQGGGASDFAFLFPALSTAVLWPLLVPLLRSVRRSYKVN